MTVENGSRLALAPSGLMTRNAKLTRPPMASSTEERGSASLRESGVPREPALLLGAVVAVRAALEEAAAAAAVAAQRARSLSALIEEAVSVLAAAGGNSSDQLTSALEVRGRAAALSPREREVLALLAEGRSNKAIAEALYVSPNTVKTHVASLLSKLHADSRAQLAVMAMQQMMR
jgi:DNA-binding NarL/FixJ family response regulator